MIVKKERLQCNKDEENTQETHLQQKESYRIASAVTHCRSARTYRSTAVHPSEPKRGSGSWTADDYTYSPYIIRGGVKKNYEKSGQADRLG